ncbi:VOC family protein [Hyphomicrobium sp. 99]|uniref:VOC family protein n=1 Tax=Hyphomicrobium sp. 99 TaxID=1163419 RepID=UPI0005F8872F|nr:VOC family protein [Hyphomicrobium sp. 99]
MGVDLNSAPAPLRILETVLYAPDLARIEDFYRRALGLEPFAVEPGRHIFYRCGDQMLLIFNPDTTQFRNAEASISVPPHGAEGEGHICFGVSGEDIDQWLTKLKSLGVPIEADFEWPRGGRSIYFRDPAGNCLEIAEPRIWGIA